MKCKKCSGVFELPMFEGFAEPLAAEPLAAEVVQPIPSIETAAGPRAPSHGRAETPATVATPSVANSQPRSNTIAVIAFVMGILSMLLFWVPLVGILLCLATLVLSIIGFVGARRGKGRMAFAVIGGVLASLAIGVYIVVILFASMGAVLQVVRENQVQSDFVELQKALDAYFHEHGHYPDRLNALPKPPVDGSKRNVDIFEDPWRNPYEYQRNDAGTGGYRLWSRGPDGESGTTDDVLPMPPIGS